MKEGTCNYENQLVQVATRRNENSANQSNRRNQDECFVKMRGLPWSSTADDILSFLGDCKVKDGKNGIYLTMSSLGRPSGEVYIELASVEDAAIALKKDREHMGHRYIEVFPTTKSEMEWVVSRCGMNMENVIDEGCIRMRGLPYGCTKEEVASFFCGLTIVPNGINFATDFTGRASGEAYVQFVSKMNVEKALKKHMEKIGHRYIEIFRSSLAEIDSQIAPKIRSSVSGYGRPAPYDRSDRFGGLNRTGGQSMSRFPQYRIDTDWEDHIEDNYWGNSGPNPINHMKPGIRGVAGNFDDSDYVDGPRHLVHMRGLPYRALEDDIVEFFKPLEPVDIIILYNKAERPSGEAIVEFATHEEAGEAMNKDKEHIQNRYIELFLDSSPVYGNRLVGTTNMKPPNLMRPRGTAFLGRGCGGFGPANRGQG